MRTILQIRQTPLPGVTDDIWCFIARAQAVQSVWHSRFKKYLIVIFWKWNPKWLTTVITMECSVVRRRNCLLSVREIIRRLRLRLKILTTMILCLSAIRSGTVVLPHRCRRSCTIMLRSSQVNVLPFLPPVVVAVSLHRLMRHGCFAPVPLSPKRCF